ncbi:MAG: hypothetical protein RL477_687 [Pseudomonadota bacterium]
MIAIRKSEERGRSRFSWLDSRHSFSFGEYVDPAHVHFGSLRVINDDWIAGGGGFAPHSHRDMEIVTYMVSGTLAHEDSTGGRETIGPNEVQRMTAGAGITHSEFNASDSEPVRLLQIWILPDARGLAPGYEQKAFAAGAKAGKLLAIASGNGAAARARPSQETAACAAAARARPSQETAACAADGALAIHQDAEIYASVLGAGQALSHDLAPGRRAWVQVVRGALALNGNALAEGDGAAVTDEARLDFSATSEAEFLLFDLA